MCIFLKGTNIKNKNEIEYKRKLKLTVYDKR